MRSSAWLAITDTFTMRCLPGWRGLACIADNLTGRHSEAHSGPRGIVCRWHDAWQSRDFNRHATSEEEDE